MNKLVALSIMLALAVLVQCQTGQDDDWPTQEWDDQTDGQQSDQQEDDEEEYPQSPRNDDENQGDLSLAGFYRLRVPDQRFVVQGSRMILFMCNTHYFSVDYSKGSGVKFTHKRSTKNRCSTTDIQYQMSFIKLFEEVDSYTLQQKNLQFKKQGYTLARAQAKKGNSKKLDGQYMLKIIDLPMENTQNRLSFKGCNSNNFNYQVKDDNQLGIQFGGRTEMFCTIDTDQLFTNALLKAVSFKAKGAGYDLFDNRGKVCAKFSPYL